MLQDVAITTIYLAIDKHNHNRNSKLISEYEYQNSN